MNYKVLTIFIISISSLFSTKKESHRISKVKLRVGKVLKKNKKAKKMLDFARSKIKNYHFVSEKERKNTFNSLKSVIEKYPNSASALNAKIRIATILSNKKEYRNWYYEIWADIAKNHPMKWQGKLARLINRDVVNRMSSKDYQYMISFLEKKAIPLYTALSNEKDPELKILERDLYGGYESFLSLAYNQLKTYYLLLGNQKKGIEISKHIISKFPETMSAKKSRIHIKMLNKGENPFMLSKKMKDVKRRKR